MQDLVMLLKDRPDFWLSLVVIIATLGIALFFVLFFRRHIREDMKKHALTETGTGTPKPR